MRKTVTYLFLLGLLFPVSLWAENNALLVWTKSGEKVSYLLSDRPVVSYSGDDLLLTTTEVSVAYPLGDLHKFTFDESSTTGIGDAIEDVSSSMEYRDNTLFFTSLNSGSMVWIYSTSGHLMDSGKADANGALTFSVSTYEKGMYILKTETLTYKIIKQ